MHRTSRTVLAAAAVAVALLGAGCTQSVPGLPAPAGAAPAGAPATPTETNPVAWMDKVCGALLPAVQVRATQPKIDKANPADTITALRTYADKALPVLDESLTGMSAAGPAPITGGDQAVTALSSTITAYRDALSEAKTKIDTIDTSNRSQVVAEFPAVVAPLSDKSRVPNPSTQLTSSPELVNTIQQAPQCRQAAAAVR